MECVHVLRFTVIAGIRVARGIVMGWRGVVRMGRSGYGMESSHGWRRMGRSSHGVEEELSGWGGVVMGWGGGVVEIWRSGNGIMERLGRRWSRRKEQLSVVCFCPTRMCFVQSSIKASSHGATCGRNLFDLSVSLLLQIRKAFCFMATNRSIISV